MPEATEDRGVSETANDQQNAFSDAFKEAATSIDNEADPGKAAEKTEVAETKTEEKAEVVEKKEEKKPEAKKDDEETAEQRYRTLQGIHKHDAETWKAEKAKLLADLEAAKAPKEEKKPDTESEVTIDTLDLTPEQKAQMDEYDADFDVVSKMEGLKREKAMAKLLKTFESFKNDLLKEIAEVKKKTAEVEAPIAKLSEERERDEHFRIIREGYTAEDGTVVAGHPDFEQYKEDVTKWIEDQPAYLQPPMKRIVASGNAIEVIGLLSHFKSEKGITETNPPENVVVMNPKKAAKKAALSAVETKRGAVNASVAASEDFHSAFQEASRKAGG